MGVVGCERTEMMYSHLLSRNPPAAQLATRRVLQAKGIRVCVNYPNGSCLNDGEAWTGLAG